MNDRTRFGASTAVLLLLAGSAGAATAPPVQPGYVTGTFAGEQDSAGILPNFNKVSGTSTPNLDIAVPQAVLAHGQNYAYTVSFQDSSYTGNCSVSYALTQVVGSTKVVLQQGKIATTSCQPGQVFAYYIISPAIPDKPGEATLTGTVKFGSQAEKLAVPVLLQ